MSYYENLLKNLDINPEIIPALLLKHTMDYMGRYHISALRAYDSVTINLYDFTKGHGRTTSARQDYIEMTHDIITKKECNFSDSEIEAICAYLRGYSITGDENLIDFETQLNAEIAEQNAYKQKLKDETAVIRHLIDNSYFLLDEDELKYIEYCRNVNPRDELMLCNDMYVLGCIAGKRAERARRKTQGSNT